MAKRRGGDDEGDELSPFARIMRERGRPFRVVPLPGIDGARVAIRCPTESERTTADAEARKHLTKGLGLSALDLTLAQDTELAKREREVQLLALVLRDADDPDQAFVESADDLREQLEEPQRTALVAAVRDFERERYESRTPEESAKIVEMILSLKAEGALSMFWTSCDSDTQVSIVHALAEACAAPTEPSSSDT